MFQVQISRTVSYQITSQVVRLILQGVWDSLHTSLREFMINLVNLFPSHLLSLCMSSIGAAGSQEPLFGFIDNGFVHLNKFKNIWIRALILCIPLQIYSNPSTWGHLGTSVRNERWCGWQIRFVAVMYVNKFKQAKFKPNCFCWWQSICWISVCVEWINTLLTILSSNAFMLLHWAIFSSAYFWVLFIQRWFAFKDWSTDCTNMPLFVTNYHFPFWYSWLQTSDLFPWGKRENGHSFFDVFSYDNPHRAVRIWWYMYIFCADSSVFWHLYKHDVIFFTLLGGKKGDLETADAQLQ